MTITTDGKNGVPRPNRVWKACASDGSVEVGGGGDDQHKISKSPTSGVEFWTRAVDDADLSSMRDELDRVGVQVCFGM